MRILRLAIFLGAVICSTPVYAARCGGDFNTFVAAMSQEAQAAGISQAVISQALSGVTQDPAVLDPVDLDEATWARAEYSSTPSKISRGKDQVAQIRAGRAQAQADLAAREERTQMADEMLKKAQAGKADQETSQEAGAP